MAAWAPRGHRGGYARFQQASIAMSLVLGSPTGAVLSSILTSADLASWGWRLPFLFGIVLALIGGYLRSRVDETPVCRAAKQRPAEATKHSFWPVICAFGFTIHWTVAFYILLAYMPTFTSRHASITQAQALWANMICVLVLMVLIPIFGAISDRIGRKPLLLLSGAFFFILVRPLSSVILAEPGFAVIALIQASVGAAIALYSGAGPAAIVEMFPTLGRSSWMTPAYALSVAIFGGFAPFIATWLIAWTGSPMAPAYYVMAASAVSFLVGLQMPETAHADLR